jgi:hypothetical protein
MRRAASAVLLAVSGVAFAQQPPKLEPLPEPPAPPPGVITEAIGDQPVTISPGPNDVVEDIVIDGKRAIRVTQPGGRVYLLVQIEATSNPDVRTGLGGGVRAPTWVLREF